MTLSLAYLQDCSSRTGYRIGPLEKVVRFYREHKPVQVDELMRYAAICRVKKIIRPYLEALLLRLHEIFIVPKSRQGV